MRKQGVWNIFFLFAIFVLSGCGEKLTEEQLVAKAREAEMQTDYKQAKKYYERLIEHYPQHSEVEAARQKVALIQSAETLPQDRLQAEIEKYEAHEQFNEALVLYQALLARFPQYGKRDEVLQKIGLVFLNNQEQYQRAIDAYQRLLQDYPDSKHAAQAQFMIGYIYANHLKDLDRARVAYDAFQKKYPQHELTPSVEWELEHLGKDISDLDFIANSKNETSSSESQMMTTGQKPAAAPKATP